MSLPSIVFWVWMTAQQPSAQLPSCTSGKMPCMYHNPAPAEHVIEVRTKRGLPDAKCIAQIKSVVPEWSPEAAEIALKKCSPRPTREIWIDGVKWGVLRERGQ